MTSEIPLLVARLLVITAAAIAFAWWQQSGAAGLALGLSLWAVVVMRKS